MGKQPQFQGWIRTRPVYIIDGKVKNLFNVVQSPFGYKMTASGQGFLTEQIHDFHNILLSAFAVTAKVVQNVVVFFKLSGCTFPQPLCLRTQGLIGGCPLLIVPVKETHAASTHGKCQCFCLLEYDFRMLFGTWRGNIDFLGAPCSELLQEGLPGSSQFMAQFSALQRSKKKIRAVITPEFFRCGDGIEHFPHLGGFIVGQCHGHIDQMF